MSQTKKLYPNYDETVWLRSCEEEITKPLEGEMTGKIPSWLTGTLLRNGPGSIKAGSMRFEHLFDSSALIHRFAIADGHVTYQCRFLRTNTLKKNRAANRIVHAEFGTKCVPDPCHTIFDRVAAFFNPTEQMTDNANVSLYPFGDELYAFTEGPFIHRIDTETLDTMEKINVQNCVALVHHTAHPHVMSNGDVYNAGMSMVRGRIKHVVVKFPYSEKGDMFKSAQIVATMNPRWKLKPAYMHSFGITENYFVIVEQPLSLSVLGLMRTLLSKEPLADSLQWLTDYDTHIVLLSRETGKEVKRYKSETFFFLHMINSYEHEGNLVVDLCTYKNSKVIDALYVKALETMQSNADFSGWFRARPKRFTISLDAPNMAVGQLTSLTDLGCEIPRIHYEPHNGRYYRYFYAVSTDVAAENPGAVIKVDTKSGDTRMWCENNCYASEPIFVPAPNAKEEDDGVILSALVWGGEETHTVGLVVLDAKTLKEIARVKFNTPSPAPRCLHGWYLPRNRL